MKETLPDSAGFHIFTDHFYTIPTLAIELLSQECHDTGICLPACNHHETKYEKNGRKWHVTVAIL
jgi:hypothetical protein